MRFDIATVVQLFEGFFASCFVFELVDVGYGLFEFGPVGQSAHIDKWNCWGRNALLEHI